MKICIKLTKSVSTGFARHIFNVDDKNDVDLVEYIIIPACYLQINEIDDLKISVSKLSNYSLKSDNIFHLNFVIPKGTYLQAQCKTIKEETFDLKGMDVEIEFLASPVHYTDIKINNRVFKIMFIERYSDNQLKKIIARPYSPHTKIYFTKEDMIAFGNYCYLFGGTYEGGISNAHNLINKWLKSKEDEKSKTSME